GTLRLWDRETGKEIRRFGKPPGDPNTVGQRPDGADAAARLAAAQAMMRASVYGLGNSGVALSPDGKKLAALVAGNLQVWEVATGKELHTIKGPPNGTSVLAFAPDRKTLAGRGFDQTIYLWDTETGKELRQIKNKPKENAGGVVFVNVGGGSASLAFSP